jgi:N-acetylmuramoyl-L-alanine amidase
MIEGNGNMKRIVFLTSFITILLVSFLGITYSYEYNDNESLKFELIGPSVLYIDVNSEYKEYGIKVLNNNIDVSSLVKIDSSNLDVSRLGNYKVKYELDVNDNKEYIYRDVIVIDKTSPKLELKGSDTTYIIVGSSYYEEGYIVSDNYDTLSDNDVDVSGKVDTSKIGEYKLVYSVCDSSGNKSSVIRNVIVKEPEITLANTDGNRIVLSNYDVTKYMNTITKNKWINSGIYIEGYVRDNSNMYKIMLKNKDNALEYMFNMSIEKDNYYKGNIDLTMVPNGEYELYIVGNSEDRLLNKMDGLAKLFRSKIGNKLIDIKYNEDDYVSMDISDFKYQYDILIDPGHGGSDVGASNGIMVEKNMNLIQSMYEKCRYESMGVKVYMTRYDDTYGNMMGTNKLDDLQRRALTVGYYGVVSRVSYSNHHNASLRNGDYGFEILVSNSSSLNDLLLEKSLYNKYKKYYNINDNSLRLYSRDSNTGNSYNKLDGKVYNYVDYYAMIRIPKELFNVKTVIYEPIYISNINDFNWYWINKKWIDVTEIKIEEYVNYLGYTYNSDNSSCI